jgi:hypothetical protein
MASQKITSETISMLANSLTAMAEFASTTHDNLMKMNDNLVHLQGAFNELNRRIETLEKEHGVITM